MKMEPYLAFANWYTGILSDRPIGWVVSVWFEDGAFRSIPVGTGLPPSTEEETIVALALTEAKLTLLPYDKLTPTQKVERDNKIKL
jgi:hypothetical protein